MTARDFRSLLRSFGARMLVLGSLAALTLFERWLDAHPRHPTTIEPAPSLRPRIEDPGMTSIGTPVNIKMVEGHRP